MDEWLPSLNALRAFEATCRHLSYARAAEELRVTPAAVKQLVRKLERSLGIDLVVRRGRGLAITAAGHAGCEELTVGFRQVHRAVGRMRAHHARRRLIVSVEPSFATAWLVPRLERFRAGNRDVDVLIDSSLHIVDLDQGAADVAVRFGARPATAWWPTGCSMNGCAPSAARRWHWASAGCAGWRTWSARRCCIGTRPP